MSTVYITKIDLLEATQGKIFDTSIQAILLNKACYDWQLVFVILLHILLFACEFYFNVVGIAERVGVHFVVVVFIAHQTPLGIVIIIPKPYILSKELL
jgi:hypothetical protein